MPDKQTILKVALKSLVSILFVVCLFKLPYGYYQLIRFIGMASFVWLSYLDNKKKNESLAIFWGCSAVLINPIIKISLGRTIWNIVDIAWALILLATIVYDVRNNIQKK